MLRQLVKHEFKATGRIVPFVYLLTIGMALVNYLTIRTDTGWLGGLTMVLLVLLTLASVIVTYVLVISRYYTNLYGSEGYLMHTLPVGPHRLLASKVIVGFTWIVASIVVVIGVILAASAAYAARNGSSLAELYRLVFVDNGIDRIIPIPAVVTVLVASVLFSILCQLAQLYFSITMGSGPAFHKFGIGGPVVIYLILNFSLQLSSTLFMLFFPLGLRVELTQAGNLAGFFVVGKGMFASLGSSDAIPAVIGLGGFIWMVLATIGLFAGTSRILSRRTSLR